MSTATSENTEQQASEFVERFNLIRDEVGKFIVGQDQIVEDVLIAIVCGGHVLLEGVPGLGKTALVNTCLLYTSDAADDGDGTATRRSDAKQRDFKRQFESFVDREDIPEDLKNGVKEYFTNIHQVEEDKSKSSDEDESLNQK